MGELRSVEQGYLALFFFLRVLGGDLLVSPPPFGNRCSAEDPVQTVVVSLTPSCCYVVAESWQSTSVGGFGVVGSEKKEGRNKRVWAWSALAPQIFGLLHASGDSLEPYLFSLHGPIGRQAGLHSSTLGIFSKCSATWFVLAVVEGRCPKFRPPGFRVRV